MIAERYLQPRRELETALNRLLKLGSEAQRAESWLDVVHGLLREVGEPLLLVVLGDAKSGRSTLLTALLDVDVAVAGLDSANDRVQLFKYGDENKGVDVSPRLTERYLKLPPLRDFSILETPGIDKALKQDRQLLQEFCQQADLVLVVLSVTNPWTQTTLDFVGSLDKATLKSVVFVLQQADLREPSGVEVVQRHLEDVARQKIGFIPPMFPVSARDALAARSSAAPADLRNAERQFAPLREQIDLVVAQAGGRTQKLRSACQIAQVLVHDISSEFRKTVDVIVHDETRVARVNALVQARKEQTQRHVTDLLRRVEQTAMKASAQSLPLLKDKLGFAGTAKTLCRQFPQQREFELAIDQSSRDAIERQIEETAQLFETDLRAVWPQLQDLLDVPFAGGIEVDLPSTPPDFARQRRELLQSVQMVVSARPSASDREETLEQTFRRTAPWLQIPTAAAILCAVTALVALKFSLPVAGVAMALAALTVAAGVALAFYRRRKILTAYQRRAEKRVADLVEIIGWQFNDAIDTFHDQIAGAIGPLASQCATKREAAEPMLRAAEELQTQFVQIAAQVP